MLKFFVVMHIICCRGMWSSTSWAEPNRLHVQIVGLHAISKFCASALPITSCCVSVMVMHNG